MGNPISDERFFFPNLNQVSERSTDIICAVEECTQVRGDIGQTSKQGRLNSRHGHRREEARKRIFYTTSLLSVCPSVRPSADHPRFFLFVLHRLWVFVRFFYQRPVLLQCKMGFQKEGTMFHSLALPSYIQRTYLRNMPF